MKKVKIEIELSTEEWQNLANVIYRYAAHKQTPPRRTVVAMALREQILVEALGLPPAEKREEAREAKA